MLLLLFYSLLAVPYFLAFDTSASSDCDKNSFFEQVYIFGSGLIYNCFWACAGAAAGPWC